MKTSSNAESAAQASAVGPGPKRFDNAGMKEAEAMMPRGVIAADKPIMLGDWPSLSRIELSSGYVRPCEIANTDTVAIIPAMAGHGIGPSAAALGESLIRQYLP